MVRAGLAAGIVLALMAVPPAAVAAPAVSTGPDDDPLQAAGLAAEQLSFVGVLQVRWSDGKADHSDTLLVQGADGSIVVRGGTSVMALPQQRLVEHSGGPWNLLWPGGQVGAGRPAPSRKYELTAMPGPAVSNRPSRTVEVRLRGTLLERLSLDAETGLLLRREQFEDGNVSRTIAFETISIGSTAPAPVLPATVVNAAPTAVVAGHFPAGVAAPAALADGYQRVGVYRRSGVVQALYSDGLYDLSLFEQRGRLDHHGLPADARLDVGGVRGWHYRWPGGHVVLWEQGGTVYTAVSDAPLSQIVATVGSLPRVSASVSLVQRLRQVCRALVQPLGA